MKTIEIVKQTLSNGNTIEYKKLENGHCYHVQTDDKIVGILERAWYSKQKLKIYFGDTDTGRDWNEEHDTIGTIGFSTGSIKIPLLITSSRSFGGGAILDHCIVKIVDFKSKMCLYINPKYEGPIVEIKSNKEEDATLYPYLTEVNGTLYGKHKSLKSAQILKSIID